MNVGFIHGNYPGQFKHLISAISKTKENNIYFITEREINIYNDNIKIKNIEMHRETNKGTHHYLTATEMGVLRGQAAVRAVNDLQNEGVILNIIVYHGGMGYGLYLKDISPKSLIIGYQEWYFKKDNSRHLFSKYTFDDELQTRTRNFITLSELESCDTAICPTLWQKKQFPKEYQSKIEVIFDGIDNKYFKANEEIYKKSLTIRNRETNEEFQIEKEEILVTYATRGMEPLRCFPEFINVIEKLLNKNKKIKVLIAGADRVVYSHRAPNESGSWKDYVLSNIIKKTNTDRISFCGLLNWDDYKAILNRSDLHCYFSRPYVLSWSFIEAASCSANIMSNKMEGMMEVIEHESIHWIDIDDDAERLANEMLKAIKRPRKATLNDGYGIEECITKWENLLNKKLMSM